MPIEAVPSTQLVAEDNAEETTNATSPTKLKEHVVLVPGTYRAQWNLGVGASTNGYSQIYVNGTAKGAIRVQRTAGEYTVQVETLPGLKAGDLVQLYAWHTNGTNPTSVGAFFLSASRQEVPTPIPGKTN